MTTTHYVPWLTLRVRGNEVAVCGVDIRPGTGSPEPTCPNCQAWLAQDASDLNDLRVMTGTSESRVGQKPWFSSTDGYKVRR